MWTHEITDHAGIDKERIVAAIEAADLAFWSAIAAAFPGFPGDFGPDQTVAWEDARNAAVVGWLENNAPRTRPSEGGATRFCVKKTHDHFTTQDGDGGELPDGQQKPMICGHCKRPAHYDETARDYQHDDDVECYLLEAGDGCEYAPTVADLAAKAGV
jgi:hypothetical protein